MTTLPRIADAEAKHERELVASAAGELALTSVPELAARLADAVGTMQASDISLEVDSTRDGDRSSTRFRFRAYRSKEQT